MNNNFNHFNLLSEENFDLDCLQGELSNQPSFNLSKLNCYLRALRDKGLIKIENFRRNREY